MAVLKFVNLGVWDFNLLWPFHYLLPFLGGVGWGRYQYKQIGMRLCGWLILLSCYSLQGHSSSVSLSEVNCVCAVWNETVLTYSVLEEVLVLNINFLYFLRLFYVFVTGILLFLGTK
jgi:hypothetical protein